MFPNERVRIAEYNKLAARLPATLFRMRCKGCCFYCGRQIYRMGPTSEHPQKYTRDHIVPRVQLKGHRLVSDVVTVGCCLECNRKKGRMTAEDFVDTYFPHRRAIINWKKVDAAKDPIRGGRGRKNDRIFK